MSSIGAGIITRNCDIEELKRALDTILEHVDTVYITVADKEKPSKEMVEYAESIGADLSEFEWCDDFSAARNFNMARCTEEWYTWLDTDDEVEGMEKARDFLSNLAPNMHFVLCTYNYGFLPNGGVSTKHPKERFIRMNGMFQWKGKLHETCVSDAKHAGCEYDGVVWNHRATEGHTEESSKRNVRIIEKELEEQIAVGKVDPRTVFNLGMAYASVAQRSALSSDWQNCIRAFLRYTKMGEWDTHMLLAWKYIGMGHMQLNQTVLARDAALQCIGLKPQYKDGYNLLAQAFERMGKLEEAVVAYEIGLTSADNEYATDVATTVLSPCIGLASCYARLGNRKKALYYIQEAKKVVGESHEFLNMLEAEIRRLDEMFERSKSELDRIKALPTHKQRAAFNELPSEIKSFPLLSMWRKAQNWQMEPPSGRDIVIYTGMGWEMWNPESAKTGIGGSEEAVIYLSKELQKLGWKVKVYGNHGTEAKDYDGVMYVPFWEWSPSEETDVFIAWRDVSLMDMDIKAKKRYVWLHDTNSAADFTEDRLKKIDKVIVLSKYHRSLYPNLPDDKVVLSANGIVPEQFDVEVERNSKKCFYSSAPDRGLHCLLQMWPKIREKVPEAELHWAYGWNTFDLAAASNPQLQELKGEIQMMLAQDGVKELGRISHEDVAKLMMSSALWLYPTCFFEVFCITAIKAQAAGAMPITTNVAALDEVVQDGIKFDVNDIYYNQEAQEKFIAATVKALQNPPDHEAIRNKAKGRWAWSVVAKQWDGEFSK